MRRTAMKGFKLAFVSLFFNALGALSGDDLNRHTLPTDAEGWLMLGETELMVDDWPNSIYYERLGSFLQSEYWFCEELQAGTTVNCTISSCSKYDGATIAMWVDDRAGNAIGMEACSSCPCSLITTVASTGRSITLSTVNPLFRRPKANFSCSSSNFIPTIFDINACTNVEDVPYYNLSTSGM